MKNSKNIFKTFFAILIVAFIFTSVSCSHKLGYSVVLWSSPQDRLYAGDLVQVYIKSNISQVYVIGIPGTKEKIEVPFWQILEPTSKSKALKAYEQYSEYRTIYANVASDGLPIRFEPVNTSRQVYRLRKGEVIKVLKKGDGVAPTSGGKPIEGDWLWVMTQDGTTGWCFSYNLRLYDENAPLIAEKESEEFDETLETILSTVWYPETYKSMISNNRVDISEFNKDYHFNPGRDSGEIEFFCEDVARSWPYNGAIKIEDNSYRLKDTPIVVNFKKDGVISIQYTNDSGIPKAYTFVTINQQLDEVVENERERRTALYERLLKFSSAYSSSNYGELYLFENDVFFWNGYQRLVPSIIPQNSGEKGRISFDKFIDSSLQLEYDGVITFTFDTNNKSVSFLYKLDTNGIRLEETTRATIKNGVVTDRGTNAIILFFGKE